MTRMLQIILLKITLETSSKFLASVLKFVKSLDSRCIYFSHQVKILSLKGIFLIVTKFLSEVCMLLVYV